MLSESGPEDPILIILNMFQIPYSSLSLSDVPRMSVGQYVRPRGIIDPLYAVGSKMADMPNTRPDIGLIIEIQINVNI